MGKYLVRKIRSKRLGPRVPFPDELKRILDAKEIEAVENLAYTVTGEYTETIAIRGKLFTSGKNGRFLLHVLGAPPIKFKLEFTPLLLATDDQENAFVFRDVSYSFDGHNDMSLTLLGDSMPPQGIIYNGRSTRESVPGDVTGASTQLLSANLIHGFNLPQIVADGEYDVSIDQALTASGTLTFDVSVMSSAATASITLDESKAYAIRSIRLGYRDFLGHAKGVWGTIDVKDYLPLGQDRWIPSEIVSTYCDSEGDVISKRSVTYFSLTKEEPLPNYDLHFPSGTQLLDERTGKSIVV